MSAVSLPRQRQLVGHRRDDARAGGAERVAERDRAAVHVEARRIDLADRLGAAEAALGERLRAEHLEHAEHLRGERLVQIDEVDVGERQPGAVERLRHRERRARAAADRRDRRRRRPTSAAPPAASSPSALAFSSVISSTADGAVGERRGVAGGDACRPWRTPGASLASFSTLVSARTRLSLCTTPSGVVIGATSEAKRPDAIAAAARWCDWKANSSCAAREISLRRAILSAASPMTSPVVRSAILGRCGRISLIGHSCDERRRGSRPASPCRRPAAPSRARPSAAA